MKHISDYIRVTQVLYPFSGLQNVHPITLKNAADRGTKVHDACDALIKGLGYPQDEEIQPYIESFEQWLEEHTFLERPARFFCDDYMITGECDGIYKNDSNLVLFDLKTPATESKTWMLQGSAYAYLARKAGYDIKRVEFIKLSKYGEYPAIFVYEENFPLFLKCLDAYKYFFNGRREITDMDL